MGKLARGKLPSGVTAVTRRLLRSWPIKEPESNDSKEERGRVLVVGGDRDISGAVLLAGIASLRSGAGKLQIATCESAAISIGVAIPEARVIALPETAKGFIRGSSFSQITKAVGGTNALLIGPGMTDETQCAAFLTGIIPHVDACTLVLDAGALIPLGGSRSPLPSPGVHAIVTPHAGEMARILDIEIQSVWQNPAKCATTVAEALNVVVVLKGSDTHIVSPSGDHFIYTGGDVGLATSGSGDTLAGIIAGLAARTSESLQAAVWGVFLHGEAGNALKRKSGRVGYLARELLLEIPPIMNRLSASA